MVFGVAVRQAPRPSSPTLVKVVTGHGFALRSLFSRFVLSETEEFVFLPSNFGLGKMEIRCFSSF